MTTTYRCTYKDGTVATGLSFEDSLARFMYARTTDNSCTVAPEQTDLRVE